MGCHGFLEKMPTFSRPSLFANNHQLIKTCQQNSVAGIARRHSCRSSLFATQGDLQVYNAMSDCISQPGKILPTSPSYHEESSEIEDVGSSWSKSLSANRESPNYTLPLLFLQIPKIASQSPFLVSVIKATTFTGILNMFSDNQALAITDIAGMEQSFRSLGDLGDISNGFSSAFLLILFSELGDKTFFIAALLASQKSATAVFIGTFGALAIMTVLSVLLGRTFHYLDGVLPFRIGGNDLPVDDLIAAGLLIYFGVTTLLQASGSEEAESNSEKEEAEIAIAGFSGDGAGILAVANTIIGTFTLVFVAEWGDKSFFSTIALAAAASPLGVVGGAVAGHAVATLIAVLGGSLLGKYIPERAIAYTGGVLFLVFAAATLYEIFI